MPTYEYRCTSCGEHLEVVQRFSEDPLTECPACGGPLRKVFAPVGILFKGSGFYKTDSRSTAAARKTDGAATGDTKAGPDAAKAGERKETAAKPAGDAAAKGTGPADGDKGGSKVA